MSISEAVQGKSFETTPEEQLKAAAHSIVPSNLKPSRPTDEVVPGKQGGKKNLKAKELKKILPFGTDRW